MDFVEDVFPFNLYFKDANTFDILLSAQCSMYRPFSNLIISISSISIFFPVAGIPKKLPEWIAVSLFCETTKSFSAIYRYVSNLTSDNPACKTSLM